MKNNLIVTILIALIVGVGGFFAGMKYQESKQPSFSRQFAGQQRQFVGQEGARTSQGQIPGNRQGFRPVNGEIIAADDKSITVKMQDGSSKIVLFSDNTTINKAEQATKSDLKTGEKVAVFGQENSDGSVTAQSIQLNPVGGFGRGLNRPSQP